MKVSCGSDTRLGVRIELDADELARAVRMFVLAHNVIVTGPNTVTVETHEGETGLCGGAGIYVDPSGSVLVDGALVR